MNVKRKKWGLLAVLLFLNLSGCKALGRVFMPDIVAEDSNWAVRETEHLYIHYRPNSQAARDIDYLASYLEECSRQVDADLDVQYRNKITFLIYSSIRDKEENALAPGTLCFSAPWLEAIVAVYNPPNEAYGIGPHEIVHVVVYWTVGMMTSGMLAEGIAVALTGRYSDLPVHSAAAGLLRQGRLKPLETMFDNKAWDNVMDENDYLYYNQAGSFVKYLVETRGVQSFKQFYTRASKEEYRASFEAICHVSIDEFYREWINFLSGRS